MNAISRYRRCVRVASLVGLAFLYAGSCPAAPITYDFEGLSLGGLSGQDNWSIAAGANSNVASGSGVNTSLAAGDASTSIMWRTNDVNFAFIGYSGFETAATMEFDLLKASGTGGTMALSNAGGPIGPFFGLTNGNFFNIRAASFGTETNVAVGGAVADGDWVRLRMDVDFTANGGNGAGSLSYKNLTAGQVTFTPVAGLQGVNLNLTAGSAPSTWDTLVFRVDSAGNLIDNMVANAIEPSTPSTYSSAVLADGPAAYWRLGEKAGNSGPLDQVVPAIRGSYGGGETLGITPGAIFNEAEASAIGYAGSAGTFSTGTALGQALFGGESQLTVEFWVRPNADQSSIHYLEYGGNSDFSFESSTLNPRWYVNNTFMGTVALAEDEFQLVDLVFDGVAGEARIYLNGQEVSLVDAGVPGAINNLASAFFLGSRGGNQRIPNADFQELAIYHAVLNGEQIYAHYYASIVPEPSTWLMLAWGAVALLAGASRRRRR